MIEYIFSILILLFGPSVISLPFLGIFSIEKKLDKKFWIGYSIIILIITILWVFAWTTQIPNFPIHF